MLTGASVLNQLVSNSYRQTGLAGSPTQQHILQMQEIRMHLCRILKAASVYLTVHIQTTLFVDQCGGVCVISVLTTFQLRPRAEGKMSSSLMFRVWSGGGMFLSGYRHKNSKTWSLGGLQGDVSFHLASFVVQEHASFFFCFFFLKASLYHW